MKIIEFIVNTEDIYLGLEILSNSTRLELFEKYKNIFDELEYDDDKAFLLPDLFYFIFATHKNLNTIPLTQLFFSFVNNDKGVVVLSTKKGEILLPHIGILQTKPNLKFDLIQDKTHKKFKIYYNGIDENFTVIKDSYLPDSNIYLRKGENLYIINRGLIYNEPPKITVEKHWETIINAWTKLIVLSPEFVRLIKNTTQEICLFNCDNQNSFASLSQFGTAFINVAGQETSEIFFIDDISHQCGHIIFYAITLDRQEYFIPHPDEKLSSFIGIQDNRTLYDIFHGLFTYTTTLYSLSNCYESILFSKEIKIEVSGRIGFYLQNSGLIFRI